MKMLRVLLLSSIAAVSAWTVAAQDIPLVNWTVPSRTTGPRAITTNGDISSAAVFIAVTPCRIVDTRLADTANYQGPVVLANSTRTFAIDNGRCIGIAAGSAAYSFNITTVGAAGGGYLTVFPAGGAVPNVSTINWTDGNPRPNAAIVPAGAGNDISVFAGDASTHVIIDINGYFMDDGGSLNTGVQLWLAGNVAGSGVIRVQNNNTTSTSGLTSALRGYMATSQSGPAAISAEMQASGGANYGLVSTNTSEDSTAAAVYARVGTSVNAPISTIFGGSIYGVRGTASTGGNGIGVLGEAKGAGAGVIGLRYNGSTGAFETASYLGYTSTIGLYTVGTTSASGVKNFVEPHPTDPTKTIKYASLEGDEVGTYFRGKARFQGNVAEIIPPDHFKMVTDSEGLSIQVTPIGEFTQVAVLEIGLDRIVIKGTKNVDFFYTVNGVRKAYKDFRPVQSIEESPEYVPLSASARMPEALPLELRQRLISNGTYNTDGTVNMQTAEKMGWPQTWREADSARATAATPAADAAMNPTLHR